MFGVLLSVFKYARRYGNQISLFFLFFSFLFFFFVLFEMENLGTSERDKSVGVFLKLNSYCYNLEVEEKEGNRDAKISYVKYTVAFKFSFIRVLWRMNVARESKLNLRADCRDLHFPSAGVLFSQFFFLNSILSSTRILRKLFVYYSSGDGPEQVAKSLIYNFIGGGTRRDAFHARHIHPRHSFCYVTEQFLGPQHRCVTSRTSRHVARAITYSRGVRRDT